MTLQLSALLFQVKAKPPGWYSSLKNSLPITIGTIPLWQSTVHEQPVPFGAPQQFASASDALPPDTGTSFAPSCPYPDIRRFHQLVIYVPIHYQQTLVLREIFFLNFIVFYGLVMLSAADTVQHSVVILKITKLKRMQKEHTWSNFRYCLLEGTEEKHNNPLFLG